MAGADRVVGIALEGVAGDEFLGDAQRGAVEFAAGVRVLSQRPEWSEWLQERGRANFERRFANDTIEARFTTLVDDLTGVAA